jgi:putative DNA primase/helicase
VFNLADQGCIARRNWAAYCRVVQKDFWVLSLTTLDDAIAQLMEFGLDVEFPICDGRVHKARYSQEKRKSGWYSLYNKDGLVCGSYGSWKVRENGFKIMRRVGIERDSVELQRLKREMRLRAERKSEEIKKNQEKTATKAQIIWDGSALEGESPYLERKNVGAFGVRFYGKNVIVPMVKEGRLRSLQCIKPDGFKKYMEGGEVNGCFAMIQGTSIVALAEGYATAASIHMATGWTVIICFTAYNLVNVAPYFRRKKCIICADDDYANEVNVGKKCGLRAAAELNCKVIFPTFINKRGTDFNDLHNIEGLERVKSQCMI